MCHGLQYLECPRVRHLLPMARDTSALLGMAAVLQQGKASALLRPHKNHPTLTSTLFPRAVYCLYLRLIHQPKQASSHHALPTVVSGTSTHPVPMGAWRLRCPVLVSDLSSLQAPGLSGSESRAAPSVLRGKGTTELSQPVPCTAVGLTKLPGTRNPRRRPKQGSILPSPSSCLH